MYMHIYIHVYTCVQTLLESLRLFSDSSALPDVPELDGRVHGPRDQEQPVRRHVHAAVRIARYQYIHTRPDTSKIFQTFLFCRMSQSSTEAPKDPVINSSPSDDTFTQLCASGSDQYIQKLPHSSRRLWTLL